MKYHKIAGLDQEASVLSFGCGAIGGLVTSGSFDEQCLVFSAAMSAGVNFFDTAPMYGNGVSETVVGKVLTELGLRPMISTKVNFLGDDFASPRETVRRSIETSLKRLNREHIDVLYLHNRIGRTDDPRLGVVSPQTVLESAGIADAMSELVQEGIVGTVACSGFGHTDSALEVLDSQRFSLLQVPANLLNPSASMRVPAAWRRQDFGAIALRAQQLGVGVIAIRALAGGSLSARQPHVYRAQMPPLVAAEFAAETALAAPYVEMGETHGGLAHMALRYAFGLPGISGVVLGISDHSQLDQALAAEAAGPLEPDVVQKIHGDFEQMFMTV